MTDPLVLLESYRSDLSPRSFCFRGLRREIVARSPGEAIAVLEEVDREVARGFHVAGYVAFDAAPGLDPVLRARPEEIGQLGLPLIWFGCFETREAVSPGVLPTDIPDNVLGAGADGAFETTAWEASIDRRVYDDAIRRIRDYIGAGDTYQVNYTFRNRAGFRGNPMAYYRALCRAQKAAWCAYLDLGRFKILSASPELFFEMHGRDIRVRPMKGTAPRGRWTEEDDALRSGLAASEKNRAENLMILDLMRNDLGRISEIGSVKTSTMFEVEQYETVYQMTSTVESRLRESVGLRDVFEALFPCGSVTGAPKIRTLQIIRELESTPRGVYTGAIGFMSPGPDAAFNVAIRTVVLDCVTSELESGVGGGITWDSDPEGEFDECRTKMRFLTLSRPDFQLLESLLLEDATGYYLLERHLDRMEGSARYFGFPFDRERSRDVLNEIAALPSGESRKVRLLLWKNGSFSVESESIALRNLDRPLRAAVAKEPVDSSDPFLYHKTTNRETYTRRMGEYTDVDDVILMNERGELTESTRGNLAIRLEGRLYTPPLDSGLLPGTYRAELLERKELTERVLYPTDLQRAEAVFLINSVRRWIPVGIFYSGL